MKGPHKPQWKEKGAPCEVCGKPRSTGIHFVDPGPCMEQLAAKAAEKKLRGNRKFMSDEDVRMARAERNKADRMRPYNLQFYNRVD